MADQTVLAMGTGACVNADKVMQHFQQQNYLEAKKTLIKVEVGIQKYIPEIKKLIERYSAVQFYYEKEEKSLTRKIYAAHRAEREAESQKMATQTRMHQYENELSRNRSERQSAQDRYERAERKRAEKEKAATGATVAAVGLTILTFGLGAPAAAVGAFGAGAAAASLSQDASRAKDERDRYDRLISDCNEELENARVLSLHFQANCLNTAITNNAT